MLHASPLRRRTHKSRLDRKTAGRRRVHLGMEPLEARQLLSGGPPNFAHLQGQLTATGKGIPATWTIDATDFTMSSRRVALSLLVEGEGGVGMDVSSLRVE